MVFSILSTSTTPRFLRVLHGCQLSLTFTCIHSTIFLIFIPFPFRSWFLFSLLYSLLASSVLTTFFISQERIVAANGTLSRSYFLYQVYKIGLITVVYGIGFIIFDHTPYDGKSGKSAWVDEMWYAGLSRDGPVKLKVHVGILVCHALNWLFLWIGLLYAAFVSGSQEGQIRLDDSLQNPSSVDQNQAIGNDEFVDGDGQIQDPVRVI